MNILTDSTQTHLISCSLWGVLKGWSVHTLIYPLEVVKIHQQCALNSENSARIALNLFKQKGFPVFYKGMTHQLLQTSLKQVWCSPMTILFPIFLQRYQLKTLTAQAITGLLIATIDAAVTTPLEKIKILSAYTGKVSFSLKDIYKHGWQGASSYWSKLSVYWVTFLTVQKHLRDRNSVQSEQPLSLLQLTKIGAQVAVIVSLVVAPFDTASTLRQAKNLAIPHPFSLKRIHKLYQGWPLGAFSLIIHNIVSVIFIDRLSRQCVKFENSELKLKTI